MRELQGTTQDLVKYLDRGERIVARLTPREYGSKPECRRMFENWKRLDRWVDSLPADWDGLWDYAILVDPRTLIGREPDSGDVPAQWASLSAHLKREADLVVSRHENAMQAEVTFHLREARHYLNRMRVLACRGDDYSPHLTWDELAADLKANGITL